MKHPVLVLVATVITAGGLWLWALLTASAAETALVTWGGGAAVVALCTALTAASYSAATSRKLRDRLAKLGADNSRLEQDLARLSEHGLPAMAKRLRDGATMDAAMAALPRPAGNLVHRLQQAVAREIAATERGSAASLAARASIEAEAATLATETVPALARRIRDGEPAELALREVAAPGNAALENLLTAVAHEIGAAERKSAAAMTAAAGVASRMQAQTTRMLATLRELEDRYDGDKVFADLLDLDHHVSQLGRMADSVALLSGGRSGRRWTRPIAIESVLRGAMGRIAAYRRVALHPASSAAVAGYAAEGVMHLLAELLDNATAFSAHGTGVHVYVEEEDAGLVITIEDGGLGMRQRDRRRAEEILSSPPDLATLPGTRLGLAVVGRLAAKHGLTVSFRPSSRGGTGAVVLIPRQLISPPEPPASSPATTAPGTAAPATPARQDEATAGGTTPGEATPQSLPARAAPSGPPAAGPGEEEGEPGDNLPRRRRGQALAAADNKPKRKPKAARPARTPRESAERFAAFRQATDRGPSTGRQPPSGDQQSSDGS